MNTRKSKNPSMRALEKAIAEGDLDKVKELSSDRVDFNAKLSDGKNVEDFALGCWLDEYDEESGKYESIYNYIVSKAKAAMPQDEEPIISILTQPARGDQSGHLMDVDDCALERMRARVKAKDKASSGGLFSATLPNQQTSCDEALAGLTLTTWKRPRDI